MESSIQAGNVADWRYNRRATRHRAGLDLARQAHRAPTIPPAGGKPLSTRRRMVIAADDVSSARKALPDLEIIEIETVVVAEFRHGRCLRFQQVLKSPSSLRFSENLLSENQADLLQLRPLKPS